MSDEKRFHPVGMGWWVDPRICSVRLSDLQRYLLAHGWRTKPQPRAEIQLFENSADEDGDLISLPKSEQVSDYVQRVIETVTTLASLERRYAVNVLSDILQPGTDRAGDGNGQDGRLKSRLPVS